MCRKSLAIDAKNDCQHSELVSCVCRDLQKLNRRLLSGLGGGDAPEPEEPAAEEEEPAAVEEEPVAEEEEPAAEGQEPPPPARNAFIDFADLAEDVGENILDSPTVSENNVSVLGFGDVTQS